MTRYTTPKLVVVVPKDLTGCDIYLSIAQGSVQIDARITDAEVAGDRTTIVYQLSQSDTARFKTVTPVTVQVNWIDANGYRGATAQVVTVMHGNLLEDELTYGN